MTALVAIAELQRRGVDVYVQPGGALVLRAQNAGARVSDAAIAFARAHRANVAAFALEHIRPKGTRVDATR